MDPTSTPLIFWGVQVHVVFAPDSKSVVGVGGLQTKSLYFGFICSTRIDFKVRRLFPHSSTTDSRIALALRLHYAFTTPPRRLNCASAARPLRLHCYRSTAPPLLRCRACGVISIGLVVKLHDDYPVGKIDCMDFHWSLYIWVEIG